MSIEPEDITILLARYREGDEEALSRLIPLVYDQLRVAAARVLRGERGGHTLEPTALVHEAYLRMACQREAPWLNRAHFVCCAARVMRNILVDYARARRADKRGGAAERVTLSDALAVSDGRSVDVLALDDALDALGRLDERQCRVVELRYFGGLSIEESAEALGVSPATVSHDWAIARAWLRCELRRGAAS
jgi:RNA polymerase sigma-70 factor (ECF subfamily)